MTHHDLPIGFLIKVRCLGAANGKGRRWSATYKRSFDQIFRVTLPYEDGNGYAAALACLAKINAERAECLPGARGFVLSCVAHDDDVFCYVATYPEVAA